MAAFISGFYCSKNALISLNILYIIVASTLISMAAYCKASAYIVDFSVMSGIIACGVFLLIVALIGLFGTAQHHQVTLFFYMIILILLFIVQFSVACACLALNEGQQQGVFVSGWMETSDEMKESMQNHYACCGVTKEFQNLTGTSDRTSNRKSHPACRNETCCAGNPFATCCGSGLVDTSHNATCDCSACWEVVSGKVNSYVKAAGGIGLFFSFTEVIGAWLAMKFRNLKDPRANPNAFL